MTTLNMTPREIVAELDTHIIGQNDAKRSVAIALRNRYRRSQIEDASLRNEIMPKNILMIGPTGVGKTEIARRVSKFSGAPFIKVEATKFTEIGFVGKDVDAIVRDLADAAVKYQRELEMEKVQHLAQEAARERILDIMLRPPRETFPDDKTEPKDNDSTLRKKFRQQLLDGEHDEYEIDIDVNASPVGVEIMAPPGMEEMTNQLQSMFQNIGGDRKKTRKVKVKKALKYLTDEEAHKRINEEEIKSRAIENVEQNGIVFIDEIDKVCRRAEHGSNADISREGVQRDLLPLVEGSTVSTKYGMVKTDHILFIASGAFHLAKPSDLIPELQGRLPIRVELRALTADDFVKILKETRASLTEQYTALMAVEGLTLDFTDEGIRRIAEVAWQVNERTENIGARRLSTVLERLLEILSFEATDRGGESVKIDVEYVNEHLGRLIENEDLARYIL